MADSKLTALSEFTPVSTDLLYGVDDPGGTPVSGKIIISALATLLWASPTLVTPVLGVASATSINKVAITAPATAATLTLADGVTLTVNASVTIASQPPILGANTFTALQTITQASANAGILASTGYSLTGSDATSMVSLAGTLNTSGNPVLFRISATNTASGATTKFLSFLAGAGGATEVFSIDKDGIVSIASATGLKIFDSARGVAAGNGGIHLVNGAGTRFASPRSTGTGWMVGSDGNIGWSNTTDAGGGEDTFLTRKAAASIQLGLADAAAPVAQTLSVQGVVAGTSNTNGAAWTIGGSISTGTGIGGSIVFATSSAAASASTQNARANALELTGNKNVVVGNAALATDAADGFLYIPTCAGTPTGTPTAYTGRVPIVFDTTNNKLYIYDGSWLGGTVPGAFV